MRSKSKLKNRVGGLFGRDIERLEARILLAADVSSPQLVESVDRSYVVSGDELLQNLSRSDRDFEDALAIFSPTVVAGSATGLPPDSPANRIDPNTEGSPFAGVGSIEVNHPSGRYICTGFPIHESYILTAAHCFDLNQPADGIVDEGTTARYLLNDGSDLSASIDVSSITVHPEYGGFDTTGGHDDVAVLGLAEPVPEGTPIYPIRRGPMPEFETFDFVGYGRSGGGDVGFTVNPDFSVKRVGMNEADLFLEDDEGSGVNEIFLFDFDEPTGTDPGYLGGGPTLGNDVEASVGGGDSGAPTFVTIDGEPHVTGIITFEFALQNITPDAGFFGSLGGGIMIDSYVPWIQEQLPNEVDIELETIVSRDIVFTGTQSTVVYDIVAHNNGPADATGVSVLNALDLPAGVSLVSAVPSSGTFDGTTWDVGAVQAWGAETLSLTLSVSGDNEGTIISTATLTGVDQPETDASNDQSIASTLISDLIVDLTLTATETIDPVAASTPIGYLIHTLTVTNNFPYGILGAVVDVESVLPAGVNRDFVLPSTGRFVETIGDDGQWELNLGGGQSAELIMLLSTEANVSNGTDVIQLSGEIVSGGNAMLINPEDDTASVATSVVGGLDATDIAVSIEQSAETVTAGDGTNLTYLVTATNVGQYPASGVKLSESLFLPTGVTVASITPSAGTYPGTDATGEWSVGDLPVGASEMLTIELNVDATATDRANITLISDLVGLNEIDSNASNDSARKMTAVKRLVDLAVTHSESADPVEPGSGDGNLVHTVTVTNLGPSLASDVVVEDLITVPSGVTVDSIVPSGSTTQLGSIWDVGELLPGGSETLTVTYTVTDDAEEAVDAIRNTATVVGVSEMDTNAVNDSSTLTTSIRFLVIPTMDFGDAPFGYPTLLSQDGARHEADSGLFLGSLIDAEADGRPTPTATGDDAHGVDDEDGVEFFSEILPGAVTVFVVNVSGAGRVDGWVDFNNDGDLNDPGEQILVSRPVLAGLNPQVVLVPANAVEAFTLARFRLSSTGGLLPTGYAADGEVEDYMIAIGDPPISEAMPTDILISGKQSPSWIVGGYSLTDPNNVADPLPWSGLNVIEVPYSGTPTLTGSELVLEGTRSFPGATPPVIPTTFQGVTGGIATWTFENLPIGWYEATVSGLPPVEFAVLPGDVQPDASNSVGFFDFGAFGDDFGTVSAVPTRADFDGDGQVGFLDFGSFSEAFGTVLPGQEFSPANHLLLDAVFSQLAAQVDEDDEDPEFLATL